jgi:hypothetical protein
MTELTRLSGYRVRPNPASRAVVRALVLALITALALVAPLPLTSPDATASAPRISADYRSFFADSALEGTGWTTCAGPITYSIDVRALRPAQRKREIKRVRWSMRQWAQAADLAVRFTGRERLRLDPASHTLHPADGSDQRDRHVYISFLREGVAPLMVDPVAGLAMPARVSVANQEVIGGVALFRARHVRALSNVDGRAMKGLYLHELGHVFGLGHAQRTENVMHPTVVRRTELGAGDRAGVRAVVKACSG